MTYAELKKHRCKYHSY